MRRSRAVFFLFLAACYAPAIQDGQYTCVVTAECPEGFYCTAGGECFANGHSDPSLVAAKSCGTCGGTSCCERSAIPAGTFNRSNDPRYQATVSAFLLDRYEVTVGRFRAMIDAHESGTQAAPPVAGSGAGAALGTGWDAAWNAMLTASPAALEQALGCDAASTWTDAPGANENKPINCVTWYEAFAFCVWDGGRLPTEAEWNYAAAGGGEQRFYPWSNPPTSTDVDSSYAVYGGAPIAIVGARSPRGDGRWGHADLAGNVWEWTVDYWDGASPYGTPCVDCAGVAAAAVVRAIRSGSPGYGAGSLQTATRSNYPSDKRSAIAGIRCAR